MSDELYKLQQELEKKASKKREMKGAGFSAQKRLMEEAGYFQKKPLKKIKIVDKRKKK